MAVLKSVIDVNNGNTGWTRQDVMDALETAIGNLGLNSGTTRTGVPVNFVSPTGSAEPPYKWMSDLDQANNAERGDTYYWGAEITQTYRVTDVIQATTLNFSTTSETGNYLVTGSDRVTTFSGAQDPGITMYVGDTITFDNTATYSGHPMYIRVSDQGASVTNPAASGEGTATVSWTPTVAGTYYYQCSIHSAMLGVITVSQTPSGGGASSGYRVEKYITSRLDYSAFVDLSSDEVILPRHGFSTGDAVRYAKGQTNTAFNLGSNVIINNLYYVIKTSRDRFKLATTLANANSGVAIVLDNYTSSSSTIEYFTQEDQGTDYVNPNIEVYYGDIIQFDNQSGNSSNFTMCRDVSAFDANQRLIYRPDDSGNSQDGLGSQHGNSYDFKYLQYNYRPYRNATDTNISCAPGTSVSWDTEGWEVTEDEPWCPAELLNPSFEGVPGADGVRSYIYCSETNASAKGQIILLRSGINANYVWDTYPYWKYTVPASGGRSELKLRIWRWGYNDASLKNITIHNIATGWTTDEVFTIPGDQIGGTSPNGDIRVGVRAAESVSGANDGTAQIRVTTLGSGSNFYQKADNGSYGILRVENDANKKYGTTFYSFFLTGNNSSQWRLKIQCGNNWEFLNHIGTHWGSSASGAYLGRFDGYRGLDIQSIGALESSDQNTYINVSTNSTPTAYPMQIRTFRAQTPQDTNFAVIQFVQIINGVVEPFGQFALHVGDGYGSNVFDLDHVFLGGITAFFPENYQKLSFSTSIPSWTSNYYSYDAANEPPDLYSQARNAYYGYMRGGRNYLFDEYYNNIKEETVNEISVYYRNSVYDKYFNMGTDAAADYYKPIKTIPISQKMVPCPYFIPDDFVILSVATTPGLAEFRPGDTVTVSGSEVYDVIVASYQRNQTGLDGVSNNTSEGILFLARTT